MLMKLCRPIFVPCSLTMDPDAARFTNPYLTANAPSGPLPWRRRNHKAEDEASNQQAGHRGLSSAAL